MQLTRRKTLQGRLGLPNLDLQVSLKNEDLIEAAFAKVPIPSPLKTPSPAPVKTPVLPAPPVKPPTWAPTPPRNTKECYPACVVRCSLNSRKNICLRACVACCDRCKCVPPGQYGNHEKCGKCYVNMTTRGGRSKCP